MQPTKPKRKVRGRVFSDEERSKGGKNRAQKLSPARRRAIAKVAARSRWNNANEE